MAPKPSVAERDRSDEIIADRYRIEGVLGRGGMATVYRAHDPVNDRRVALKMLAPRGNEDVIRFKREFRAASRLHHVACVEVYDLGEHAGEWFFTMEHLPHGSLHGKKVAPRVAAHVGLQVLGALDHIHSRQIVHRDLKPSNILLADDLANPSARVKLADFGIARVGDTEDTFRVGELIGSLGYLSPEQAKSDQVDPRSDLYSLGLILFELITGHGAYQPIGGGPRGWMRAHLERDPRTFAEVTADLRDLRGTEPLEAIVRRMLAKDPSARYATAADVHDAITAWLLADHSLQTPPVQLERGAWLAFPEMVGRDREAKLLDDCVTSALRGDPNVPHLLIAHGEAGVGKSRLVSRALPLAESLAAWVSLNVCRTEPGAAYEPLLPVVRMFGDRRVTDAIKPLVAAAEAAAGHTVRDPTVVGTLPAPHAPHAPHAPTMRAGAASATAASGGVEARAPEPTVVMAPHMAPMAQLTTELTAATVRASASSSDDASGRVRASGSSVSNVGSGSIPTPSSGSGTPEPAAGEPAVAGGADAYSEREAQQWQFHRRIADGLITYCRDRPVLLLIDDIQWADPPTLSLLGYLVRAIHQEAQAGRPPRVAFVCTHRPAEGIATLEAFKTLASGYHELVDIALTGLDQPAIGKLIVSMMPGCAHELADSLAGRLLAQGNGNPLYAAQALHTLVSSQKFRRVADGWAIDGDLDLSALPTTVSDAIGERAARFPTATKQTLTAAAVVGRGFDVDLLAEACELDAMQILDGLDDGIRAGFVEEVSGGRLFRFVHDRFREAIYQRVPHDQAVELHRRIADALAPRVKQNIAARADLAFHELHAERWAPAYLQSIRAARDAMALYAWAKAADLYRQALTAADRMQRRVPRGVLERFGDVSLQAGRFDDAAESYRTLLDRQKTALERADTLRRLADVEYRRGDVQKGVSLMKDVLVAVNCYVPRTSTMRALAFAWQVVRYLPFILLPWLMTRKKPVDDARLGIIVRSSMMLFETCVQESLFDGAYFQLVAVNHAERMGPGMELVRVLAQQGILAAFFNLNRTANYFYARAKERMDNGPPPMPLAIGFWYGAHGLTSQSMGDVHAAIADAEIADVHLRRSGDMIYLRWNWVFFAQAHVAMNDCATAAQFATKIFNLADEVASDHGRAWGRYVRGRIAAQRGEFAAAIAELEPSIGVLDACGDHLFKLSCMARLAQVKLEQADFAGAMELALVGVRDRRERRVRMPHVQVEGVFLATTAAYRKRVGALPPEIAREARAVARWGRQNARSNKLIEPYFNAGVAALALANGDLERGLRGIADALALADRRDIAGEKIHIHVLAAIVLGDHPDAAAHAAAAVELRRKAGSAAV